jgi:hypothetical protein
MAIACLSRRSKIEDRTIQALEGAYSALQQIVINLYAEADNAVAQDNYNDASLLQSQGDKLYETLENLGVVIEEQEE